MKKNIGIVPMAPIFVNVPPSNPTMFDPLPMKTPSIVNSPLIIQSITNITPHVSPTPNQIQIVSSLVPTPHPSSTILNILTKSPHIKKNTPKQISHAKPNPQLFPLLPWII
jgi:hypothetical protein